MDAQGSPLTGNHRLRGPLFSPEEWAELEESGWILSDVEVEPPERSHRVSVAYPPGEYEGNEDPLRARVRCL
jgi:hypothetical protein